MKVIRVKELLKTLRPTQVLQIFHPNKIISGRMVSSYTVDNVPKDIQKMWIGSIVSRDKTGVFFDLPANIESVLLLDVFISKRHAIETLLIK